MPSGTSLGEVTYASLYLSPLAFGYLSFEEKNPFIAYFDVPISLIDPIQVFWLFTAISFLGAMQTHGALRAIFGPGGPEKRPKHNTVFFRHSLAFILRTRAEAIPVVPCRLAHNPARILTDVVYGRNRLEIALVQLKEIGRMITLRRVPRIVYFLPMGFHRLLSKIAFIALGAALYLGTTSYVAFVLFTALFVLLFRKIIWLPFPPVYDDEGLKDRFVPEYQLHESSQREVSSPRIQGQDSE